MHRVEKVVHQAISLLLLAAVLVATAVLYVMFFRGLWTGLRHLKDVADLQNAMQQIFAGVLVVMIGLEVLETLREYSRDLNVRLQIVFAIAGIAVARHLIQLDFEAIDGPRLIGLGVLVASLGLGYGLTRRLPTKSPGT